MSTLLWLAPAAVAWAAAVCFFWKAGAWLPYYVLGSTGCALLLVVVGRDLLPLETGLRVGTARVVDVAAGFIGLNTRITTVAPGNILVVGVPFHQEWTNLSIGLECSGLLESSVLMGLVAFFPAYSVGKRSQLLLIALAATFVANVVRMMVIVGAVGLFGQGTLEIAHVVLGRVVFFALAVGIYWFVITKPTLRTVNLRLRESR